ncbi:hypothetical protein DL89DRAFT_293956 [Linderina pennispora]|uniref:Uncharacterized protein n=1 Tax=Linderina pennispora TaxID=61395 RepID=A0A1Y1W5Y4_9FUNG|nr:uncharacterized protein DL89DRAFT_293956 [Linderina pennispora]ORX68758.1 hypothetical protein DL89DRAFT_293956 [Linderina pennispora]
MLNMLACAAIASVSVMNVRAPRFLNSQMRFLFTYGGRGLLYTYFGCIVYTNSLYNIIACVYTVTLGVAYLVLAWVSIIPLQHGLLYNWSHWCSEGAKQMYESSSKRTHRTRRGMTNEQYDAPLLGTAMPGLNRVVKWVGQPDNVFPGALGRKLHAAKGEAGSRIYGMSTRARRLSTTGDAYLDEIVNSSRFARDMMDPSDSEYVVAGDSRHYKSPSGLASRISDNSSPRTTISIPPAAAYAAEQPALTEQTYMSQPRDGMGTGNNRISSPLPYHLFAPESREFINNSLSQITRELEK